MLRRSALHGVRILESMSGNQTDSRACFRYPAFPARPQQTRQSGSSGRLRVDALAPEQKPLRIQHLFVAHGQSEPARAPELTQSQAAVDIKGHRKPADARGAVHWTDLSIAALEACHHGRAAFRLDRMHPGLCIGRPGEAPAHSSKQPSAAHGNKNVIEALRSLPWDLFRKTLDASHPFGTVSIRRDYERNAFALRKLRKQ